VTSEVGHCWRGGWEEVGGGVEPVTALYQFGGAEGEGKGEGNTMRQRQSKPSIFSPPPAPCPLPLLTAASTGLLVLSASTLWKVAAIGPASLGYVQPERWSSPSNT
jgi:hypothetical protein